MTLILLTARQCEIVLAEKREPPLTRADVVRLALRDWATATAYLPLPPAREDAN